MQNVQDVNKLLKNAKELKGSKFKNVFISRDYTPRERAERKRLEAELRERREYGEENLIIRAGKIVQRHKETYEEPKNERGEASRLHVSRD